MQRNTFFFVYQNNLNIFPNKPSSSNKPFAVRTNLSLSAQTFRRPKDTKAFSLCSFEKTLKGTSYALRFAANKKGKQLPFPFITHIKVNCLINFNRTRRFWFCFFSFWYTDL